MDDSEQIKMFVIMLCNFTALVIMYFIAYYSKDGGDYRDRLKKVKVCVKKVNKF